MYPRMIGERMYFSSRVFSVFPVHRPPAWPILSLPLLLLVSPLAPRNTKPRRRALYTTHINLKPETPPAMSSFAIGQGVGRVPNEKLLQAFKTLEGQFGVLSKQVYALTLEVSELTAEVTALRPPQPHSDPFTTPTHPSADPPPTLGQERRSAAVRIQRHVRGFLVCFDYRIMRFAATEIQRTFRGFLARNEVSLAHFAATEIQRIFRGCIALVDYVNVLILTHVIQRAWRGFKSRKIVATTPQAPA